MSAIVLVLGLAALLAAIVAGQRRWPLLPYLFFCRFPLWTAAALVALAFFPRRLGDLFWLPRRGVLLVAFLAPVAAWVVMVTADILLRYAPARFGVPPLPVPRWVVRFRVPLAALLALPVVGATVAASAEGGGLAGVLVCAALGALLAGAMLAVATALQWVFSAAPEPELLLPRLRPLLGGLPRPRLGRGPGRLHRWLAARAGPGYRDPDFGGFLPGHLMSATFFGLTLGAYAAGYLAFRWLGLALPALAYLLLIATLAGWVLPGAAFWLDRYRVPVLLLVAAASFLSSQASDTDHYFRIVPEAQAGAAAAAEAARAPAGARLAPGPPPKAAFDAAERLAPPREPGPIVVVAASGGGIAASLWTARVLTGLQREVGEDFARSIRLVSAVSGGSAGTLFYLDRFGTEGRPPPREALDGVVDAAASPSLDEAAWGFAYPDLWRGFFGFLLRDKTTDRGLAVETAWRRRLRHPDAMLSEWRRELRAGRLPAVVFNATTVETGRQFLLTGLDLPTSEPAGRFFRTFPGYDLPVVRAARLSAAFPWVGPIARQTGGPPRAPVLHLGDGGYYDNFGVATAIDWLRSLLPASRGELERRGVLLVLIRAGRAETGDGTRARPGRRGWVYSAVGPVVALMNVRSSSQTLRNSLELDMLRDHWGLLGIRAETAVFELAREAPLSWKLTAEERRRIEDAWTDEGNRRALARVRCRFSVPPPG